MQMQTCIKHRLFYTDSLPTTIAQSSSSEVFLNADVLKSMWTKKKKKQHLELLSLFLNKEEAGVSKSVAHYAVNRFLLGNVLHLNGDRSVLKHITHLFNWSCVLKSIVICLLTLKARNSTSSEHPDYTCRPCCYATVLMNAWFWLVKHCWFISL